MSTTRVSLADLAAQPHEYSAEETAFREKATDEDLHRGALADSDAQPWTDEMFRRGQKGREARREGAVSTSLDMSLERVDASTDVPTWAVTDEQGETVYLQAANVVRASPGATTSAVKIVQAARRSERRDGEKLRRGGQTTTSS